MTCVMTARVHQIEVGFRGHATTGEAGDVVGFRLFAFEDRLLADVADDLAVDGAALLHLLDYLPPIRAIVVSHDTRDATSAPFSSRLEASACSCCHQAAQVTHSRAENNAGFLSSKWIGMECVMPFLGWVIHNACCGNS